MSAATYRLVVSMDVDADKEALFNEVYDSEHLPALAKVPGVVSATRFRREPLVMSLGGAPQTMEMPGEPAYVAVYEIESPEVVKSQAWADAGAEGRWIEQVRPFTRNRRHVLYKMI